MFTLKKIGLAASLTACIGLAGAGVITNAEDFAIETESGLESTISEEDGGALLKDLGGEPVSDHDMTIQEVVKTAMPAMVSITNTSVEEVRSYFRGDPFDFFNFGSFGFGDYYDYGGRNDQPQTRESVSMGTGVIVGETDDDILIATNEHVVNGATELSAAFIDETAAPAEIIGSDASHDLAIVKVSKSELAEETVSAISLIPFGSSSALEVGEQVIAIGNALGYGQSVSAGIVSALNRSITSQNSYSGVIEKTEGMIQTDASINPGNSGGALLNMRGELVGINSAKYADTMVEGMGYAIPVDTAEPILTSLANGQPVSNSFNEDGSVRLGVTVTTITEDYQTSYLLPKGVYVVEVEAGGPAANAGVQKGDIITAIDGKELASVEELKDALTKYGAGDSAKLTISRQGTGSFGNDGFETGTLTVVFGNSNEANMAA